MLLVVDVNPTSDIDHHLLDRGNVDVAVVMVEWIILRSRGVVRRDGIAMSTIRMMCVGLLRFMWRIKIKWELNWDLEWELVLPMGDLGGLTWSTLGTANLMRSWRRLDGIVMLIDELTIMNDLIFTTVLSRPTYIVLYRIHPRVYLEPWMDSVFRPRRHNVR